GQFSREHHRPADAADRDAARVHRPGDTAAGDRDWGRLVLVADSAVLSATTGRVPDRPAARPARLSAAGRWRADLALRSRRCAGVSSLSRATRVRLGLARIRG